MDRRLTGILGEEAAARHYRGQGYELLTANYRTRQGEVDLIAQKNGCLVFVEVRTRKQGSMLTPGETVTPAKQRRLIAAAKAYLAQLGKEPQAIRFDVAQITCQNGRITDICCIENAFYV